MPEQKVTLLFPSMRHLWDFVQEINVSHIEVVTATISLTCNCHEQHIQLAKEKYGARLRKSSTMSNN